MNQYLKISIASLLLATFSTQAQQPQNVECDRDCLKSMVDSYLAAMGKHDPDLAPLDDNIVMTENRVQINTSEGLWSTVTAIPGEFQIYVPDEARQEIGYLGVLEEGDHLIELGMRLKVEDGKITEAEHVVAHSLTASGLANLKEPRAMIQREVPEAYRDSRSRITYIASGYYRALALDNGDYGFFADDCVRRENGMQTTRNEIPSDWTSGGFGPFGGMGCDKQLDTQVMAYIDDVGNNRIMVVDEKNGLAMGYAHLEHEMAQDRFPILDVPGIEHRDFDYEPFDNIAMHIFKVWGGEVHEIEALGYRDPWKAESVWPMPEPVAPVPTESVACDRECLKGMVDTYLSAMVKHDPKVAPLADNLVSVENLAGINPGEGLWQTLSSSPTDFQIYVPDVKAQQIGYIGILRERTGEGDQPIQLGLRLKIEDGKIVEAEHVVVRDLSESSMANLQTPRMMIQNDVPAPYRDSRGRLLSIAASYYEALDRNNGDLAPFADDCVRMENGMQTARNTVPFDPQEEGFGRLGALGCEAQLDTQAMAYIDTIDNRRVWIADEETGLAFGLSHFHHSMQEHEFPIIGVAGMESRTIDIDAFDLPAVHIFKIWDGKIHEIEALGYVTDYKSKTGW